MDHLNSFEFGVNTIRVLRDESEPLFIARDVALLLGYASPKDAISAHCKGAVKRRLPSAGGEQEWTLIPERDVYRLIMRSKMPKAEAFEEWVVGEVLPAIRKTGTYNVQKLIPDFSNPAIAARAWADQYEQREALACQVQTLTPKAEFTDRVNESVDGQSIGEVAKVLGTGQNRLFAWLRGQQILMGSNLPYQEHIDAGRFRVIEQTWEGKSGQHVSTKTLITGKGLIWITKKWDEDHRLEVTA